MKPVPPFIWAIDDRVDSSNQRGAALALPYVCGRRKRRPYMGMARGTVAASDAPTREWLARRLL